MHELSIAMNIVEMAEEELRNYGSVEVLSVHLRLGKLSGVVRQALLGAFEMACYQTPLEGAQLLIEEVPIEVFCPQCQVPKRIHSVEWFSCPDCGTPTPTILHGKELEVLALEFNEIAAPAPPAAITSPEAAG